MRDQLPPPTVSDALRDLARGIDDNDLPAPTHIGVDDEEVALVVAVYSDDFDQWAEVCLAGRIDTTEDASQIVYHAARGHLCGGRVRLTVHAFDVPAPTRQSEAVSS